MEFNVAVTLRITPKNVNTDLSKIDSELKKIADKYGRLHSSEIKPIAFGLRCIEAALLFNDSKGGMDEAESELRKVKGVSQVDVLDINRL